MVPEKQTGPERYQAAIPINFEMSLALRAWVGDPGAAVPIIPPTHPPKIFLPRELAALDTTEHVTGLLVQNGRWLCRGSRQRSLFTWQAGGFVSRKLCLASPAVAKGCF